MVVILWDYAMSIWMRERLLPILPSLAFPFHPSCMIWIDQLVDWGIILHYFLLWFVLHIFRYCWIAPLIIVLPFYFYEIQCRKGKDLYLWMAKCPNGPSVKFLVSAGNVLLWFQYIFHDNLLSVIKKQNFMGSSIFNWLVSFCCWLVLGGWVCIFFLFGT